MFYNYLNIYKQLIISVLENEVVFDGIIRKEQLIDFHFCIQEIIIMLNYHINLKEKRVETPNYIKKTAQIQKRICAVDYLIKYNYRTGSTIVRNTLLSEYFQSAEPFNNHEPPKHRSAVVSKIKVE